MKVDMHTSRISWLLLTGMLVAPGTAATFDARDRLAKPPPDAEAWFSAGYADESAVLGGIDTAIWRSSDDAKRGTAPLVIFSHGYRGCNTQSAFLARALANGGYLVVAPNHADTRCGPRAKRNVNAERPFREPKLWDAGTYRARREDVASLVAALKSSDAWQGRIDWSRVALAGHSLGGYTALALAGAWTDWRIEGLEIKAVLALSPYVEPFNINGTLKAVKVPIMFQGGTKDTPITPSVKRAGGAYDQAGGRATYLELAGAGHFAWTDRFPAHQDVIARSSLAFLDAELRGKGAMPAASRRDGVSQQRSK
jgi:predicted dienelactone hydrolase